MVQAGDLDDFGSHEAPGGVLDGDFAVMRAHLAPDARRVA